MIKNSVNELEDESDDDEEESPILKEIPVFLSQTLAEKLVVYQYPLEHNGLNTDNSNVIKCSIKQNPHEVMLELEKNTSSPNYSMSKAEQIAIKVDGRDTINKNPEEVTFPKNIMDRQSYISCSLSDQNLAVGILHENELHLTPLKNVALLRPSFKYIDKGDKRLKKEAKDLEGDNSGEEEEELKQVTVKFARQESEKIRKAREKSFSYINEMNSKETWYTSNFYCKGTDKSEIEFCKLYCNTPNDKAKEIKFEANEIFQNVCIVDENEIKSSSHGDSLRLLKTLPILDKVKRLLFQARLIQFSKLIKYLGNNYDIQDYLKIVQQVAVLVQGCWVVQSDILYFKEIVTGGISGSLMRAARDYIKPLNYRQALLKRFWKNLPL
ncbi:DNA-directed RNA polymerases III 80 kDa polypeptide, putative [Pediculus humanus corporis]|uniref:DNA-directed RNA polymerases III 80 kDa polypeptide, putative n=1 Tax=Pediculus humanus subsp. corporis TaxID=121224 RepID=E0VT89_PEDHC|nr:DNA-directed RNA polymerases III 80 kDa polypeptide, putative [Pediculus humanus corporis]EEB16595.1 DNA-directed RNA polymerases III 80 kDa polypeptide, putative [Pediculus humanus corporis]